MISQETDDLILVNIDDGSVSTSCSEMVHLPQIPPAATDRFTQRCPLSSRKVVSPLLFDEFTVHNMALDRAGALP